jgi:hypothetical protein
MVAVVGAVAVARGRQGYKTLSKSEQEVARMAHPEPVSAGLAKETSGVFSHEIHVADNGEGAKEST